MCQKRHPATECSGPAGPSYHDPSAGAGDNSDAAARDAAATLATREVLRYVYLRTGRLLSITAGNTAPGKSLLVARKDHSLASGLVRDRATRDAISGTEAGAISAADNEQLGWDEACAARGGRQHRDAVRSLSVCRTPGRPLLSLRRHHPRQGKSHSHCPTSTRSAGHSSAFAASSRFTTCRERPAGGTAMTTWPTSRSSPRCG